MSDFFKILIVALLTMITIALWGIAFELEELNEAVKAATR
jgi:hypothetical protein